MSQSRGRVELRLDPEYGDLWTGPAPAVSGAGFAPLTEMRVEVSCHDAHGRLWKSSNEYLVSAEGSFDTSRTAAVGEGYYGIAPEGPFYSMVCQDGPGHDFASKGLQAISYQFRCLEAQAEIWTASLVRRRSRARELWPEPRARVLLYHEEAAGAESDAALALGPYGIEVKVADPQLALDDSGGVPDDLPLFVLGLGRASASALETAVRLKSPAAVILFSGGGLRFDPIQAPEQDTALDHIPLDHSSLRPKADGFLITRKVYADAVAEKATRERGRIQVEKISSPVFMFSGLDDQIFPASAFSELVAQRRKIQGCPYPTYHRTFEGVGHDLGPAVGLPTLPTTERTVAHLDTGFRLLLGGKMGRQARARRECWDSLLKILKGEFTA